MEQSTAAQVGAEGKPLSFGEDSLLTTVVSRKPAFSLNVLRGIGLLYIPLMSARTENELGAMAEGN